MANCICGAPAYATLVEDGEKKLDLCCACAFRIGDFKLYGVEPDANNIPKQRLGKTPRRAP